MRSRRSRQRSIDKQAGLLRLTTILAHSSGEWVSSEWPVCQITDIASAQRMGAALTYARRYALFTLVGIAGEDDLDAPDLGAAPKPAAELPRPGSQSNGQAAAGKRTAPGDGKLPESAARSVLGVQLSASLRESLIEQMAAINSADEAAAWAHRNLPAKNTLTAADAKIVEERFRARLSAIDPSHGTCDRPAEGYEPPHAVAEQTGVSSASDAATRQKAPMRATKKQSRSDAIRALGKTVRLRDKDHRQIRAATGVPRVRPRAVGSASSHLYTTACTRAPCERRVHRPGLPSPPSRATSLW